MLSVLIPFKGDFGEIEPVVQSLLATATGDLEVVIVNDGSTQGSGKFRPLEINLPFVKVINNHKSFGVGYAFDRAFENSTGDIIVLMGADIFVKPGWFNQVIDAVTSKPETLGCSVCIGLNPTRMSLDDPKNFRRYGADLLFYVDEGDLPKESLLGTRRGGYTSLFKAKWLLAKQSDEPYEIPCVLGAFYFTSRDYFKKLGGWDTESGNQYAGHRVWGSLEPYISLKSWLVGGGCTLYPEIETGHVFARVDRLNKWKKGGRGEDWGWWNRLYILETMIMSQSLRNRLEDFVHPELNFNVARKWIKQNYESILRKREENRLRFKNYHTIFTDKFGYDFDIN